MPAGKLAAIFRTREINGGLMSDISAAPLKRTPLFDLHEQLGAKLVPFAGYEMPVQYQGILAEHLHARSKAVLFDVSHMGQVRIQGDDLDSLEQLVVADIQGLQLDKVRYSMLTNANGGIIDDLMVARVSDALMLVVNASRKDVDFARLKAKLPACKIEMLENAALLALQGPSAGDVIIRLAPEAAAMRFMTSSTLTIAGITCFATRSGYTGEDGFEISCAADHAEDLAKALLAEPDVMPAGLGARDTLRLEAGLCLWGNDIDETTTPVEAGLSWAISPRRRREGGFPGDSVILGQLQDGPSRRRVGICLQGRAPARSGCPILDTDGSPIGTVTSGGYAPSVGGPVAMGYVNATHAAPDTPLQLVVRGKPLAGTVVRLPFIEHRYVR